MTKIMDNTSGTTMMTGGRTRMIDVPGFDSELVGASPRPVVGWLVVVEGPGKGSSRELSIGYNRVGREGSNDVPLNFGDEQISRTEHFRIGFEPKGATFSVSVGQGTNIVYVDGVALETSLKLTSGNVLEVGGTKLRFVALCGPDWSWT